MNFGISQEFICKFCENTVELGNINRSVCEGLYCSKAKDMYMDEHGLVLSTETIEPTSFSELRINDTVYRVTDDIIPEIKRLSVIGLKIRENGLNIILKKGGYIIIEYNKIENNQQKSFYLNYICAKKVHEKVCMERIIKLAKVIENS